MYENIGIHICRANLFAMFFNQKNQNFTINYDTKSYNLDLVNVEFCLNI